MRIKLPLPDLSRQKVIKPINHFLDLEENYLLRSYEFNADEMAKDENDDFDKSMPWQTNIYNNSTVFAMRKCAIGADINFLPNTALWCVGITLDGFNDDIKMYFKSKDTASKLFDDIMKWILK